MNLELFANKLRVEKSVAIFCHYRPDGDTIGSAMALMLGLEKLNITAKVFCADKIPNKFNFLSRCKEISNSIKGEFTAFFAIDNADVTRLGDFAEDFMKSKNTYSLDHHVSNTNFAKYNCVIDNASNCENVFKLLNVLGVSIDKEIANFLLLGIVTDTGNFKHKNVTENTLLSASKLVGFGADINAIVYNTFTKQTKERAKLFGYVMSKIRYFYNDRVAIATIFTKDLIDFNVSNDQTEGFIDFVLAIDSVEVAVCIMQVQENKYKISLRSKKADVNSVAGQYGGGGHVLASGCQIFGEYEEVVDKLTYTISQYLED